MGLWLWLTPPHGGHSHSRCLSEAAWPRSGGATQLPKTCCYLTWSSDHKNRARTEPKKNADTTWCEITTGDWMKLLCVGTPVQNAAALSDPCGQPSKTHLPTHCESERTCCPVSAQPSRTVARVAQPHPPWIGRGYLGKEKSEKRLQNLQN